MSQENVELARQAYAAYNRYGIAGILGYLDPEVEWRNPTESPNAAVFIGHDGVREWQGMVDAAFEEMHFEPGRSTSSHKDKSSRPSASGFARRQAMRRSRSPSRT